MSKVGYQRHDMERISKTLYGESDVEEKKRKRRATKHIKLRLVILKILKGIIMEFSFLLLLKYIFGE